MLTKLRASDDGRPSLQPSHLWASALPGLSSKHAEGRVANSHEARPLVRVSRNSQQVSTTSLLCHPSAPGEKCQGFCLPVKPHRQITTAHKPIQPQLQRTAGPLKIRTPRNSHNTDRPQPPRCFYHKTEICLNVHMGKGPCYSGIQCKYLLLFKSLCQAIWLL